MAHPAAAVQQAIFTTLARDAAVAAFVSGRVFDRVPTQPPPPLPYLSLGPDQILDDSTGCSEAYEIFAAVHVWSRKVGQIEAKQLGAAVQAAIDTDAFEIEGWQVTEHQFQDARYFPDPDGLTTHGVLTFRLLLDPQE